MIPGRGDKQEQALCFNCKMWVYSKNILTDAIYLYMYIDILLLAFDISNMIYLTYNMAMKYECLSF